MAMGIATEYFMFNPITKQLPLLCWRGSMWRQPLSEHR